MYKVGQEVILKNGEELGIALVLLYSIYRYACRKGKI